jgi:Holliday junction resolvase RusA-like endonuclease
VILTLPYPPTANNLFKNIPKGRAKSFTYRAWINAALWELKRQRPQLVRGAYRLTITAVRPDNRARDVDNLIKPISDTLKKGGVIEDDAKAKSVFAVWSDSPPVAGGEIRVIVEPDVPDVAVAA